MVNIKIKEIPKIDRPRERLIAKGGSSLSDEELLAIILNGGIANISAKELAFEVIKYCGGLDKLNSITLQELLSIRGIGEAKACLVLALIELSKRLNQKQRKIVSVKITSPDIVFEYYKYLGDLQQEHFYCLYLDSGKRVLKEKLLFIGTVNHTMIHPRDIFKEAYLINAVSIICLHNHPSGDINPSREDLNMTFNLKKVGELLGIEIIDHVIIGKMDYYSFLENSQI